MDEEMAVVAHSRKFYTTGMWAWYRKNARKKGLSLAGEHRIHASMLDRMGTIRKSVAMSRKKLLLHHCMLCNTWYLGDQANV